MEVIEENIMLNTKNADILSSDGSTATFYLSNPIVINNNVPLYLSLLEANVVFNQPNISSTLNNNTFTFTAPVLGTYTYTFDNGIYDLNLISNEIQEMLTNVIGINASSQFSFTSDDSTSKIVIYFQEYSGWSITVNSTSIMQTLGFSIGTLSATSNNTYITSQNKAMLNSLRLYVLQIPNLVSGTYFNDATSGVISQFTPSIAPYSQYTYAPLHISNCRINRTTIIDKITTQFVTQDGVNCDFTGGTGSNPEYYSVRLRLSSIIRD